MFNCMHVGLKYEIFSHVLLYTTRKRYASLRASTHDRGIWPRRVSSCICMCAFYGAAVLMAGFQRRNVQLWFEPLLKYEIFSHVLLYTT